MRLICLKNSTFLSLKNKQIGVWEGTSQHQFLKLTNNLAFGRECSSPPIKYSSLHFTLDGRLYRSWKDGLWHHLKYTCKSPTIEITIMLLSLKTLIKWLSTCRRMTATKVFWGYFSLLQYSRQRLGFSMCS